MPNDQLSRIVESKPQTVDTIQSLTESGFKNDRLKATYTNFTKLVDGTTIPIGTFTTERVISTTPELSSLVAQIYALTEQYRQEDDQQRADDLAKSVAEQARWAALTPEEKKAEISAKREAAENALLGISDIAEAEAVVPKVP